MSGCDLFTNGIAIVVQGFLGIAVFSLLILKWKCEKPRRQFQVWIFDALKQCISAGFQHACNVAIASVARSEGGRGDEECGWYMISFTIDACLGTALSLLLLKYVLEPLATKLEYRPLAESGDYGQPDNINVKWWGIQLTSWVVINILARVVCGALVYGLHDSLYPFVRWITDVFKGNGVAYLLLSMIGTPTFLNIIQLIIQDTCLKKTMRETDQSDLHVNEGHADKLPLMHVSEGEALHIMGEDEENMNESEGKGEN